MCSYLSLDLDRAGISIPQPRTWRQLRSEDGLNTVRTSHSKLDCKHVPARTTRMSQA